MLKNLEKALTEKNITRTQVASALGYKTLYVRYKK